MFEYRGECSVHVEEARAVSGPGFCESKQTGQWLH